MDKPVNTKEELLDACSSFSTRPTRWSGRARLLTHSSSIWPAGWIRHTPKASTRVARHGICSHKCCRLDEGMTAKDTHWPNNSRQPVGRHDCTRTPSAGDGCALRWLMSDPFDEKYKRKSNQAAPVNAPVSPTFQVGPVWLSDFVRGVWAEQKRQKNLRTENRAALAANYFFCSPCSPRSPWLNRLSFEYAGHFRIVAVLVLMITLLHETS